VLDAIIGQVPVVVSPGEALLDVLLGLKALHELDDLEVGHIDLRVLGGIEILLGVQHTLLEEILVNLHAVLLRNQHGRGLLLAMAMAMELPTTRRGAENQKQKEKP